MPTQWQFRLRFAQWMPEPLPHWAPQGGLNGSFVVIHLAAHTRRHFPQAAHEVAQTGPAYQLLRISKWRRTLVGDGASLSRISEQALCGPGIQSAVPTYAGVYTQLYSYPMSCRGDRYRISPAAIVHAIGIGKSPWAERDRWKVLRTATVRLPHPSDFSAPSPRGERGANQLLCARTGLFGAGSTYDIVPWGTCIHLPKWHALGNGLHRGM
jgi:hypothetical protein